MGREKFTPSPNVDSAVVRIDLCPCRLQVDSADVYKKVVRAAFSSRRKTLENNLINGFSLSREKARELIAGCGLSDGVRGETLSPEQFACLANAVGKM